MSLTPSTYVNESLHVYSTFTTALASHEHGSKWPSDAVFYLEKFDRCGCWRVSVFPPESEADETMKSYSRATSWGQLPCTVRHILQCFRASIPSRLS